MTGVEILLRLPRVRMTGGANNRVRKYHERYLRSQAVSWSRARACATGCLTGIRHEDVRGAADIYTVLREALPFLEGATLIIQNAGFDLGFLQPRLRRLGYRLDNPVVDTIHWARKALPGLSKRGLDSLAWAFDLGPIAGRHRALGDVETTLQVAHEMYYMLTAGKPTSASQVVARAF